MRREPCRERAPDGAAPSPSLSIVVPVLDEAGTVERCLAALAPLRARGAEVIVVDGGSSDGTRSRAASDADRVIDAPRGRASQMNAGAAVARGDTLLFLHADTRLPPDADRLVENALAHADRVWGRFDVRIAGRHPLLPLVAWSMSLRSRLTGIATGDQAIFVRRSAFDRVGGYRDIPLMEDIALSGDLSRITRPACISAPVRTSGRRWDRNGAWRTILLMWRLRLAFALKASPHTLAARYGYAPRKP